MGRSESVIWRYFVQVTCTENNSTSKYKKGRCKFCSQEYVSNAQRMHNHLVFKCNKCPESVKPFLSSEPTSQIDTSDTNTSANVIEYLWLTLMMKILMMKKKIMDVVLYSTNMFNIFFNFIF